MVEYKEVHKEWIKFDLSRANSILYYSVTDFFLFSQEIHRILTSACLSLERKCSATCTGRMLAKSLRLYASKCSISSFSSVKFKSN